MHGHVQVLAGRHTHYQSTKLHREWTWRLHPRTIHKETAHHNQLQTKGIKIHHWFWIDRCSHLVKNTTRCASTASIRQWIFGMLFSWDGLPLHPTSCSLCLQCLQKNLNRLFLQSTIMEKSLGTLSDFWGIFKFMHAQPLPSLHKQRWMRVSRIFYEFQLRDNCKKISKRMHCFLRESGNYRKLWILKYCPKDFCPWL